MKKFFTLIAAIALSVSLASAQEDFTERRFAAQSKLSITTMINAPVSIVIDGNKYNAGSNDDETMINNIRPGYHFIKVFQQKKNRYNNAKWGNKGMQLIYESNLYIKAQYHVDITINRFGKAFIDEQQISGIYYNTTNDDDNSDQWDNIGLPGMDDNKFEDFKQVMQHEMFDNSRLAIARKTIAENSFSSMQVKEMMQLFSFDNSKLEIAKSSYRNTVDKNNYFMIYDCFAFSTTKEELAKYIETSK